MAEAPVIVVRNSPVTCCLLGHCGSGKSTLFSALTGAAEPVGASHQCTHGWLRCTNRDFLVLDVPGLSACVEEAISACALSTLAIAVVSASNFELEFSMQMSRSQFREHLLIAFTMGVKNLIVVVNKMDTVDWSMKRFQAIADQILPFCKRVGYSDRGLSVVPISALSEENVSHLNHCCTTSLLQLMDNLSMKTIPSGQASKPLRFSVFSTQGEQEGKTTDASTVKCLGAVLSGKLEINDVVRVAPWDVCGEAKVTKMQTGCPLRDVSSVTAPTAAVLELSFPPHTPTESGADEKHTCLARNAVLCSRHHLPRTRSFTAQVIVLTDNGESYTAGHVFDFYVQCGRSSVRMTAIQSLVRARTRTFTYTHTQMDKRTGKTLTLNPPSVGSGQAMVGEFELLQPIHIERFSDNSPFGRFVLRDAPSLEEKEEKAINFVLSNHIFPVLAHIVVEYLRANAQTVAVGVVKTVETVDEASKATGTAP